MSILELNYGFLHNILGAIRNFESSKNSNIDLLKQEIELCNYNSGCILDIKIDYAFIDDLLFGYYKLKFTEQTKCVEKAIQYAYKKATTI
jgi:hypothetical protein